MVISCLRRFTDDEGEVEPMPDMLPLNAFFLFPWTARYSWPRCCAAGFPLATGTTPVGTPDRLVEVYPHPALMTLTGVDYRLPYKVSRSRRYWPESSPAERKANLLIQFAQIASALKGEIRDIPIELPGLDSIVSTSGLKRYEDSLDALVCAWVGVKYLEGEAVPYGDGTAAIWVP